MKTAREIWGETWREVDVMQIATPDKRRLLRACGAATHAEMVTFGTACNALLLSVRRIDDVDRRHYSGGRERYAPLRPGVWTLRDLEAAFALWRAGERYVRGLGPACDDLLAAFFEVEGAGRGREEVDADPWRDARDIFMAILDVAHAAERLPVRQQVGGPAHLLMDQFLQNITALARAGLTITEQSTGMPT